MKGQIIRISSDQISKQGRAASGIRLVRVSDDDKVIAASRAPAQPEENLQNEGTVSADNEPKIENETSETTDEA